MKCVYIGWGSLIWDYKNLPININPVTETWISSSLKLPLEFSRISDKGCGRMTLVIDENGQENNVFYSIIRSKISFKDAITAIRRREKTITKNIGFINLKTNEIKSILSDNLINNIKSWMIKNKIEIAIWTDIQSNWKQIRNIKYSPKNGFEYFSESDANLQIKMFNYIYRSTMISKVNTQFTKYFFDHLAKLTTS